MGTYVFFILTILLLSALVISQILRGKELRKNTYDKIKSDFGNSDNFCGPTTCFDRTPSVFGYMQDKYPESFCIDDITVNDLSLRDLYSRMNRCVTKAGEEYLYCRFRLLSDDTDDLYEQTVEYAGCEDKAVEIIYILKDAAGGGQYDGFAGIRELREKTGDNIVSDIIPLVLLALSIASIALWPVLGIIATLVMICVCIWGYFRGRRQMDDSLKGFIAALKAVSCSKRLAKAGCTAFDRYRELELLLKGSFLISVKDQTSSSPLSILFDYVRMITHIDIIAYKLKISRIAGCIELLESLYCDIGKLDCALATASYIKGKKYCRAKVSGAYQINAKQIYHPLVATPVYNDFSAQRGILITGSNASGKSTFLKAVAVNVLFARSFGIAFADEFETGKFRLYTSMALSDNLLGKESYYVVEARSIKRMCDVAGRDCLFIIDEVLKGTNTVERIAAGANILKYLCNKNALCFAATHDRELTHLLKDEMDMYHFTEEIHEDSVTFPFVIRSGVANNANAIRLLAMLGFDSHIVNMADSLVEHYDQTGNWTDIK